MMILVFIAGLVALAGIYAMFSISLNVNGGMLGLWDLGVVGYLAVGAYAYTIMVNENPGFGMPMWTGMIAAIVITALLSLIIGYVSLRLQNEYLLITTFAFAEIIRIVITNEKWLTNGNSGIFGIDKPFDQIITGSNYMLFFAGLVLVTLLIYYLFVQRLSNSPMGRLLRALRDNEQVSMSIGKNIFHTKLKIFVLSSTMIGFTGCFYVWYMSIVAPNMFVSMVTFTVWTAIVLGGIGNFRGAVLGAFFLIIIQEMTRFIPVPTEYSVALAGIRQLLPGLMLIIVLRYLPRGLLAEKNKSVESLYNLSVKPEGGMKHASSQGN